MATRTLVDTTSTQTITGKQVTATGSTTARTLEARFGEFINVKDYGATGDGPTDDTTAIQAALDAANAGSVKRVYFPAGRYSISQIAIYSGLEVFGNWLGDVYGPSGAASTDAGTYLIQKTGVNDDAIVFNGRTASSFWRVENVYLHDFVLTKSGTSDTLGNGISARQTGQDRTVNANHSLVNGMTVFERLMIRGFPENGMYFKQGAAPMWVRGIYTLFNGGYGVKYEGLNYSMGVSFRDISGDGNKGGAPLYVAAATATNQVVVDGVFSEYRSDNSYGNTGAFGGASPYGVVVGPSSDTVRMSISNVLVSSIVTNTAPEAAIYLDTTTQAQTPAITFVNCTNRILSLSGGSKKTLIDARAWGTQVSIPNTITTGSYSALATTTPVIQHMSGFVVSGDGYTKPAVGDYGFEAVGTVPAFTYVETDAGVDEKGWFSGPSSGSFYFRTQTDDAASSSIYSRIDRTGNAVSVWSFLKNTQHETANAATWKQGSSSELLTLSTSGTTTDTSMDLPANSIIEAVVARVTTTITTATDWKLGDPTTSGRFSAASSTMTAGATVVGTVHADQTGSAGPRQPTAAKVRVTTTGTPGAGAIRITIFFRQFVAPTS